MTEDLEQLVEEARPWNAVPLLFYILSEDTTSLPQSLRSLSREQYLRNYVSNTLLLKELKDVLNSLAQKSVEVMLLKGAAFNLDIYPLPGLRPMHDIDLLIHREELAAVIEILCAAGYQRYPPPARNRIEKFQGEVTYIKGSEFPMIIEPHWTLGPEYPYAGRIEVNGLWSRARKAKLAGAETLVLCPEDALLHQCLHLFQHSRSFWLISACEIVRLIRHYEGSLDWHTFLNRVDEFELCLPVQYSLKKTLERFHPPIPDFVFNRLNSYQPGVTEKRLFNLQSSLTGPIGAGNLVKLLTIPGFSQKLRYAYSILLPSKQWLTTNYPDSHSKLGGLYVSHLKNVFVVGTRVMFRFVFQK